MKQQKHINEFFLEGLSAWLRENGRSADADLVDGIEPSTFFRSGYKSGTTYGSSGNPNRGSGISWDNFSYNVNACTEAGDKLNKSIDFAVLLQQVPESIRPKYIGQFPASSSTVWDPKSAGMDVDKPGCRAFAQLGGNGMGLIVFVGSDEDPKDLATVESYLPFKVGFTSSDWYNGGWYGSAQTLRQSANLFNNSFTVLVYQGSKPAGTPKGVNQNLPVTHFKTIKNEPKSGYTTVPAFTMTPDYESLRGKYSTKVHYYQLILDAMYSKAVKDGNDTLAGQIKSVNPKTFVPFKVTFDSTNKRLTMVGAQCSTSKLYFAGITLDIYQYDSSQTRMYPAHFPWVYTAESGLQWTLVADQSAAGSYKGTGLIAENQYKYFMKHFPKGTLITGDLIKATCPFDMTGIQYVGSAYGNPASTQGDWNWYNELRENHWCGSSSMTVRVIADLT